MENNNQKETPTIPVDKILEEFKSMQKTLEELHKGNDPYKRDKKNRGGVVSLMDKEIYYPKIRLSSEILRDYRRRFKDGGSTDLETDEGMTRYIVSILDGAQGLNPFEMKLLEESLQELKEKYGK
jgi:hypothetical protein